MNRSRKFKRVNKEKQRRPTQRRQIKMDISSSLSSKATGVRKNLTVIQRVADTTKRKEETGTEKRFTAGLRSIAK